MLLKFIFNDRSNQVRDMKQKEEIFPLNISKKAINLASRVPVTFRRSRGKKLDVPRAIYQRIIRNEK